MCVLAGILMCGSPAQGQEMPAQVGLQASLLARIWGFDKAHPARIENGLVVAVAFQELYRPSLLVREAFEEALLAELGPEMGDRLLIVPLNLSDPEELAERLGALEVDILYVAPLRAFDVARLIGVTRELGILSCTGVPDFVEQGVSLGVGINGGKPEILVHLRGAREEGATLSSQLLKLARVVGSFP